MQVFEFTVSYILIILNCRLAEAVRKGEFVNEPALVLD